MMRSVFIGALAVVAALTVVAASASAGPLRYCWTPSPNANQGPRDDREVPFGALTARNITCLAARAAIRNGYLASGPFHTRGFSCKVVGQSQVGVPGHGGVITGQTIHCLRRVSGHYATFQFGWAT